VKESPHTPHAEQIVATVLFADLVGFDRFSAAQGTEQAYLAVTHLLRVLDEIARRHGGSVDKYLGDKLMVLFGHPLPLRYPDRSAAAAALEMVRRVSEYNREAGIEIPLGIHVGINTGQLVSGDIRGPVVREFHVLGDAVNVAARINARTPEGEIWLGAEVRDAIADEFILRHLPALSLKGKSQSGEVQEFSLLEHLFSQESPLLLRGHIPSLEIVDKNQAPSDPPAHLRNGPNIALDTYC
jgi:class 3 adenylate cyclase